MEDIAIITMQNVMNYGAFLQSYASQRFFEDLGYSCVFYDYYRKNMKMANVFLGYFQKDRNLAGLVKCFVSAPTLALKKVIWTKAKKKYLKETSRKYFTVSDFYDYPVDSNYYCVGSDQVWNSEWSDGILPELYLGFVEDKSRCFSYCSSFGKSTIPFEESELIHDYLSGFKILTVREPSSKTILQNSGISNVVLGIDPVFMVSKEVWTHFANKWPAKSQKYVLLYNLKRDYKLESYAKEFARYVGLPLIQIGVRLDYIWKAVGKLVPCPSLEKFVSLFRDSEYVVTDSFHGTSFGLIFNKKIICRMPERFGSRISDILSRFNISERLLSDYSEFDKYTRNINYDSINQEIVEIREEVKRLIVSNLAIGKEINQE